MKNLIRSMSARQIHGVFVAIYLVALAMALVPPLYFWASGASAVILGLPMAVWYWILIFLLVGFALWGLYIVEDIRGELNETLRVEYIGGNAQILGDHDAETRTAETHTAGADVEREI